MQLAGCPSRLWKGRLESLYNLSEWSRADDCKKPHMQKAHIPHGALSGHILFEGVKADDGMIKCAWTYYKAIYLRERPGG